MKIAHKDWKEAQERGNLTELKKALRAGIRPSDLDKKITIKSPSYLAESTLTPIEILLTMNNLGQDYVYIETADKLLTDGAKLPDTPKFEGNKNSFFFDTIHSSRSLFLEVKRNPKIIFEKDEKGLTLLHHAATLGYSLGSNSISLIITTLFDQPKLDFSIADSNKHRPIDTIILNLRDRVTRQYQLINFMREAKKRGHNFNEVGPSGYAYIHLAAKQGELAGFLSAAKTLDIKLDLNILSKTSKSSALFYALISEEENFSAALSLAKSKGFSKPTSATAHKLKDTIKPRIEKQSIYLEIIDSISKNSAIDYSTMEKKYSNFLNAIIESDEESTKVSKVEIINVLKEQLHLQIKNASYGYSDEEHKNELIKDYRNAFNTSLNNLNQITEILAPLMDKKFSSYPSKLIDSGSKKTKESRSVVVELTEMDRESTTTSSMSHSS